MGTAPSERENDGRLGRGGPQGGPMGGTDDERQTGDPAGMEAAGTGQGGQRHRGSSRDTDRRHREEAL